MRTQIVTNGGCITGENIGASILMNHTMMGDPGSLADRLEDMGHHSIRMAIYDANPQFQRHALSNYQRYFRV